MRSKSKRKTTGGALIETVAGLFILIPVVLFLIDVVSLVLAQTAHDKLAKDCARAAAEVRARRPTAPNQPEVVDPADVNAAIDQIITRFNNPVLVVNSRTWQNPPMNPPTNMTPDLGLIRVELNSTFTFPVAIPFAGNTSQVFVAEAVEPTVGLSERIKY